VIYEFEDFELDTDLFELRRRGERCHLEPQVLALLHYLVEHRDRVVPKEELLDNIWGHRFVGEAALTSRLKSARQAVGDSGKAQRCIRTTHGRGYRFVAETQVRHPDRARPAEVPADAPAAGAPPASGPPRHRPFPRPLDELVGRSDDLARLRAALDASRLVTVTGPGGVGKTRLATEAGAATAGPVHLVELSHVRDPDLVGEAFLTALGLTPSAELPATDRLVQALDLWAALLVVDNCEHLLDGVAAVAERVLRGTERIRILATSREPLGLSGERVVPLSPLALPAPGAGPIGQRESAAVQLFLARCTDAGTAVAGELSVHDDMAAVVALCQRLDGLPLALELAAARTRMLSPREILDQLDAGWGLAATRRDGPRHHVTLHDTIDWSFRLLAEPERRMLVRLGVFAGSFDLAAAAAVAGHASPAEAFESLARLVERSLVQLDAAAGPGPARGQRYRLLQTVRDFVRPHLDGAGGANDVGDRHMRHYAATVEARRREIPGPREDPAFALLALDLDNVRVAFAHALERGDVDAVVRLALGPRLAVTTEAAAFADLALRAVGVPGVAERPELPALLGAATWAAVLQGDLARARACVERGTALVGDVADEPQLCWVATQATSGRYEDGADACLRGAAHAAAGGDAAADVFLRTAAAVYRLASGDERGAAALAQDAWVAAEALGSTSLAVRAGTILAYARRDLDPAGAEHAAADVVARARGADHHLETAHRTLAVVAARRGDWATAARHAARAATLLNEQGDRPVQAVAFRQLALIVGPLDPELAAQLLGTAHAMLPKLHGLARDEADERRLRAHLDAVLGERAGALVAQGARLDTTARLGVAERALRRMKAQGDRGPGG
jgi:predicted ATPase/DNA-binding winged helix-turn-helix (wHTH) protein